MRYMKKLVAAVLSVAMLGAFATTSFAGTLDWTNEIEFSATVSPATVKAGEDVTVSFFVKDITTSQDIEMDDGGSYYLEFAINEDVVTYKSHAIGQDYGSETFASKTVGGDLFYTNMIEPSATATIAANSAIFTYVFTVKSDVTAGTYDIITNMAGGDVSDMWGMAGGSYSYSNNAKITVAGGDDDTIKATKTAGTNNDSYEFANVADDSKVNGQKVALRKTKVEGTAITENTRVKVTAAGRTQIYGGDMWAKLNAEGEGTLAAKNVTFGIIFSDADLTADSFTFEIIEQ